MPARRVAGALGLGRSGVRRIERDGIPIYHAVTDGPTRAALMFRVGRGDEAAADGGVTHLVEHLALFPFGQRPYEYNGFVDALRTIFVASGQPDEVAHHLTDVCRNLAALPLDRLPTEQRVLRDEGSRRPVGPTDHHAWLRWGLRGSGLTFVPEYGLWRLAAADVERWSDSWFTAGNAALVWIGPKLPSLDLPLPGGPRKPTPALTALTSRPVWAVGGPNMVAVSFSLHRTSADASSMRILTKRLQQRLRYDHGLSYDVTLNYQPLDAGMAMATLAASTGASDAVQVRDIVIEMARELERDGPSDEELAAEVDASRRQRESPFALQGDADRLALGELLGADPKSLDDINAELAAVTPGSAAEGFRGAMRTAILTQPPGTPAPQRWLSDYPNLSSGTVDRGAWFADLREKAFGLAWKFPVMVLSEEVMSVAFADGSGARVQWREVAVAIYGQDASLTLVFNSGAQIPVFPRQWRRAKELQGLLERHVPAERFVILAESGRPTWVSAPIAFTPLAVAVIGVVFYFAAAGTFLGSDPILPFTAGPLMTATGLLAAAIAPSLLVMAIGATAFRGWSGRAATVLAAMSVVAAVLALVIGATAEALLLALPALFAGVHLRKLGLAKQWRPE